MIRVQRAKFEQKGGDYVPKKKAKSKKKAAGVLSKQEKELGWGGFDDKLAANKVSSRVLVVELCLLWRLGCVYTSLCTCTVALFWYTSGQTATLHCVHDITGVHQTIHLHSFAKQKFSILVKAGSNHHV